VRTALPPIEAYPKAKRAAERAVELDDTLAEAHLSLALIKQLYDWDLPAVEREFKRAIELDPNYALGHGLYSLFLTGMGRFDESAAEARRAKELDPISPSIHIYAAWSLYHARQFDRSIEEAQKAIELDPGVRTAYIIIVRAYAQKKMFAEAIAEGERARGISKDHPYSLGSLGYAYAVAGKPEEARKILEKLKELSARSYVSPYHIATIYVGLGENYKGLEYLEKTCDERDEMVQFFKVEPMLDSIRTDPRFTKLLQRLSHVPPSG
jgi:tetratricopeptide (TPR) repeat protein